VEFSAAWKCPDCALDETQTEKADIEIEVPLRIARNRSDVMQSPNGVHQPDNDVRFRAERSCSEIRTRLSPTPRPLYARATERVSLSARIKRSGPPQFAPTRQKIALECELIAEWFNDTRRLCTRLRSKTAQRNLCDVLPRFGRRWYTKMDDGVGYAKFYS
jgi:hypothetical protein